MVFKRSEYRHQFKVASLEKNIPVYQENLKYRNTRRERECAHTPIAWEGEITESESDEKSAGDEDVDNLPISKLAIPEEEEDEEDEEEDDIAKEKREAQEKDIDTKIDTNDKDEDEVKIVTQDEELRKSAKEKLNKYAWKENKDEESNIKSSGMKKQLGKTFVKPKKIAEKGFSKASRPRRPDRKDKIPRPASAPASRQKCTDVAKSEPFLAYGCGAGNRTLGEKKTFNVRASSAVYPAALRAKKRNAMMVEKLQEKQRAASAKEKKKKALFNEKMARETIAWDTEYQRNYPAYSNSVYAISGPDRSPRKQKSHFTT